MPLDGTWSTSSARGECRAARSLALRVGDRGPGGATAALMAGVALALFPPRSSGRVAAARFDALAVFLILLAARAAVASARPLDRACSRAGRLRAALGSNEAGVLALPLAGALLCHATRRAGVVRGALAALAGLLPWLAVAAAYFLLRRAIFGDAVGSWCVPAGRAGNGCVCRHVRRHRACGRARLPSGRFVALLAPRRARRSACGGDARARARGGSCQLARRCGRPDPRGAVAVARAGDGGACCTRSARLPCSCWSSRCGPARARCAAGPCSPPSRSCWPVPDSPGAPDRWHDAGADARATPRCAGRARSARRVRDDRADRQLASLRDAQAAMLTPAGWPPRGGSSDAAELEQCRAAARGLAEQEPRWTPARPAKPGDGSARLPDRCAWWLAARTLVRRARAAAGLQDWRGRRSSRDRGGHRGERPS